MIENKGLMFLKDQVSEADKQGGDNEIIGDDGEEHNNECNDNDNDNASGIDNKDIDRYGNGNVTILQNPC